MSELIFSYTRAEAIADGLQKEIPLSVTKDAGLLFPVYVTEKVWNRYIAVPEEMKGFQDEEGRQWDIVWMLSVGIRMNRPQGSEMRFKVIVQFADKGDWTRYETATSLGSNHREVTLKVIIGATDIDDPAPCLTVCLVDED